MKGGVNIPTAPNRLIIPTAPHTLDCFNTAATRHSNGTSLFHLDPSTPTPLFIAGLFSYIYKTCNPYDNTDFTINTQSFREYLGFSRGGRSKDIRQVLLNLNDTACYIRGKQHPLATVTIDGRLTLIHSDYFNQLADAMKSTEGSRYTSIIHADIVRVKSQPSAEVCLELCKLIERRGSSTTAPAHISIKTLIERCPTLRREIHRAPTNSRRNQIIRYALSTGVNLMATATNVHAEYSSLTVVLPTMKSVVADNAVITATHDGKNIQKKEDKSDDYKS